MPACPAGRPGADTCPCAAYFREAVIPPALRHAKGLSLAHSKGAKSRALLLFPRFSGARDAVRGICIGLSPKLETAGPSSASKTASLGMTTKIKTHGMATFRNRASLHTYAMPHRA